MTVSKRVLYSGHVQGVGFRYTARNLAGKYRVAGFVRNLPGGEVELAAEGPAAEVDAFLGALGQRMADSIQDTKIQDEPPAGYQGFDIRY